MHMFCANYYATVILIITNDQSLTIIMILDLINVLSLMYGLKFSRIKYFDASDCLSPWTKPIGEELTSLATLTSLVIDLELRVN